MKVAFTTWCTDDYFDITGCKKLINSANYFHPEIPFFRVSTSVAEANAKRPYVFYGAMMAISCLDFIEEYDLVVHIDADSTITGRLDELLQGDYEVAGVRNYSDHHLNTITDLYTVRDVPVRGFLNAGLVASKVKNFWTDWEYLNSELVHSFSGWENDTLNILFHSGRYKTKILDTRDRDVYYGVASVWNPSSDGDRNKQWDSWKNIYVKDDKLFMDSDIGPKKVKVLHHAGGGDVYPKQVHEKYFSGDVLEYLRKITA